MISNSLIACQSISTEAEGAAEARAVEGEPAASIGLLELNLSLTL
jgi:hypothetical protein